jgi:hypothetical protein
LLCATTDAVLFSVSYSENADKKNCSNFLRATNIGRETLIRYLLGTKCFSIQYSVETLSDDQFDVCIVGVISRLMETRHLVEEKKITLKSK